MSDINYKSQKRVALLVATLSSFLTPFMSSAINVAIPSIAREFSTDAVLLSWLVTAFLLTSTTLLIPFGRIADIYGRKRIFIVGVIVFSLASLFCASSMSMKVLLMSRVVQGIGGAMMFGTSIAILVSVFPYGERGKALGINVSAVYAGLSIGPSLGGVLTHYISWRAVFIFSSLVGVLITLFASRLNLPIFNQKQMREKFDFLGSILFCLSLFSLMLGLSQISTKNGQVWFLAGCLGTVFFVFYQSRNENPLFALHLFKNRVFAFSNLAALINYTATSAVSFIMSIYLQEIKVLSPRETGLILLCQPFVQALLSPFAGALSDRVQPRFVASAGMFLTALALFAFSFIEVQTTVTSVVLVLMVLGLGFALFSSPNTSAAMSAVHKQSYGVASAMLATMRLTGGMIAMTLTTLFINTFLGGSKVSSETAHLFLRSAKTAFIVFSALCIVGVVSSLIRGKTANKLDEMALNRE
ncbi:MAG: MFS transporter [Planctomycetota bacterium]|nr:MFS transporter [Planctomycetota bacterium]